jgi:hypothetical protein
LMHVRVCCCWASGERGWVQCAQLMCAPRPQVSLVCAYDVCTHQITAFIVWVGWMDDGRLMLICSQCISAAAAAHIPPSDMIDLSAFVYRRRGVVICLPCLFHGACLAATTLRERVQLVLFFRLLVMMMVGTLLSFGAALRVNGCALVCFLLCALCLA